ncbi:hypothetical protein AB6A23_26165 [Paenibacillus tarimensis]
MSIERQLTETYKVKAQESTPSAEFDARVWRRVAGHMNERGISMRGKKNIWLRNALIALVLLVVVGFSSQMLFQAGDDRFSMRFAIQESSRYDAELARQVREQLQQVKSGLQTGETAVVYSPEWAALFPPLKEMKIPVTTVSNLREITDLNEWIKILEQNEPEYRLPTETSLTFAGGIADYPFGGFVSMDQLAYGKQLLEEYKRTGQKPAWIVAERGDAPSLHVFTSFYVNERQEEISVTMELVLEKIVMEGIVQSGVEEIRLNNGTTAYYISTDRFVYSETDKYQELFWLETLEDTTVVYKIGTVSESVTKEELVKLAETME